MSLVAFKEEFGDDYYYVYKNRWNGKTGYFPKSIVQEWARALNSL